jgi:hypothetical protein
MSGEARRKLLSDMLGEELGTKTAKEINKAFYKQPIELSDIAQQKILDMSKAANKAQIEMMTGERRTKVFDATPTEMAYGRASKALSEIQILLQNKLQKWLTKNQASLSKELVQYLNL